MVSVMSMSSSVCSLLGGFSRRALPMRPSKCAVQLRSVGCSESPWSLWMRPSKSAFGCCEIQHRRHKLNDSSTFWGNLQEGGLERISMYFRDIWSVFGTFPGKLINVRFQLKFIG